MRSWLCFDLSVGGTLFSGDPVSWVVVCRHCVTFTFRTIIKIVTRQIPCKYTNQAQKLQQLGFALLVGLAWLAGWLPCIPVTACLPLLLLEAAAASQQHHQSSCISRDWHTTVDQNDPFIKLNDKWRPQIKRKLSVAYIKPNMSLLLIAGVQQQQLIIQVTLRVPLFYSESHGGSSSPSLFRVT